MPRHSKFQMDYDTEDILLDPVQNLAKALGLEERPWPVDFSPDTVIEEHLVAAKKLSRSYHFIHGRATSAFRRYERARNLIVDCTAAPRDVELSFSEETHPDLESMIVNAMSSMMDAPRTRQKQFRLATNGFLLIFIEVDYSMSTYKVSPVYDISDQRNHVREAIARCFYYIRLAMKDLHSIDDNSSNNSPEPPTPCKRSACPSPSESPRSYSPAVDEDANIKVDRDFDRDFE